MRHRVLYQAQFVFCISDTQSAQRFAHKLVLLIQNGSFRGSRRESAVIVVF
jgi:hypothetical protein